MANISGDLGGHGQDLNLVPFIDLLSTLVIFLVATAIWTQVATIPVAQVQANSTHVQQSVHFDCLTIQLNRGGILLQSTQSSKNHRQIKEFQKKAGDSYDFDRLSTRIAVIVKNFDLGSVAVDAEDNVDYSSVVRAIDIAKATGFKSVSLVEN